VVLADQLGVEVGTLLTQMTPFNRKMSTLLTLLKSFSGLFTSSQNSDEPTGANAVRTAVTEYADVADRDFTVTLGEPDVVTEESQFFNDPKIIIPVYDVPFNCFVWCEVARHSDLPTGCDTLGVEACRRFNSAPTHHLIYFSQTTTRRRGTYISRQISYEGIE
jgi:hypothetical protein